MQITPKARFEGSYFQLVQIEYGYLGDAFRVGLSIDEAISALSRIDSLVSLAQVKDHN